MQLIVWATLGLAFGALTERAWQKDHAEEHQMPNRMTAQ
jgi:hypothetical protein